MEMPDEKVELMVHVMEQDLLQYRSSRRAKRSEAFAARREAQANARKG